MNLELTVRQRIVLENIIRAEKSEDNDVLELLVELRKKIGFIKNERDRYLPIINGQIIPNEELINQSSSSIFEFEKAEIRKIEHLLKGKQWTTEDAETWYYDLKKKLNDIKIVNK